MAFGLTFRDVMTALSSNNSNVGAACIHRADGAEIAAFSVAELAAR
ncbi:hypothetical protein [Methylopila sp. 73B]|nr:hypothetical protein [Methylopila sp. 73B]